MLDPLTHHGHLNVRLLLRRQFAAIGTENSSSMLATSARAGPHGSGETPRIFCTVSTNDDVSNRVIDWKPRFAFGEIAMNGGSSCLTTVPLPSAPRRNNTPPRWTSLPPGGL